MTKRTWARKNPVSLDIQKKDRERRISRTKENGFKLSESVTAGIGHAFVQPHLLWAIRVAVPFSYAASKNHLFSNTAKGHVFMRRESRVVRDELTLAIKMAAKDQKVVHNKVWIALFVQKPNHKGDAVNVIDLVCDAIKDAIGVDDRWFCIRQLDWQITKTEPAIYVEIGQSSDVDSQACSSCGRILALEQFNKKSSSKRGVDRNCRECRTTRRG